MPVHFPVFEALRQANPHLSDEEIIARFSQKHGIQDPAATVNFLNTEVTEEDLRQGTGELSSRWEQVKGAAQGAGSSLLSFGSSLIGDRRNVLDEWAEGAQARSVASGKRATILGGQDDPSINFTDEQGNVTWDSALRGASEIPGKADDIIFQALGSMVPYAASAVVPGGAVGSLLATMGITGGMAAGEAKQRALQEVDPSARDAVYSQEFGGSFAGGAASGIIEQGLFRGIGKAFKGGSQAAGEVAGVGSIGSRIRNDASSIARSGAVGAGTEATQETLQQLSSALGASSAASNVGQEQAADKIVGGIPGELLSALATGGIAGGGLGAGARGAGVARDAAKDVKAKAKEKSTPVKEAAGKVEDFFTPKPEDGIAAQPKQDAVAEAGAPKEGAKVVEEAKGPEGEAQQKPKRAKQAAKTAKAKPEEAAQQEAAPEPEGKPTEKADTVEDIRSGPKRIQWQKRVDGLIPQRVKDRAPDYENNTEDGGIDQIWVDTRKDGTTTFYRKSNRWDAQEGSDHEFIRPGGKKRTRQNLKDQQKTSWGAATKANMRDLDKPYEGPAPEEGAPTRKFTPTAAKGTRKPKPTTPQGKAAAAAQTVADAKKNPPKRAKNKPQAAPVGKAAPTEGKPTTREFKPTAAPVVTQKGKPARAAKPPPKRAAQKPTQTPQGKAAAAAQTVADAKAGKTPKAAPAPAAQSGKATKPEKMHKDVWQRLRNILNKLTKAELEKRVRALEALATESDRPTIREESAAELELAREYIAKRTASGDGKRGRKPGDMGAKSLLRYDYENSNMTEKQLETHKKTLQGRIGQGNPDRDVDFMEDIQTIDALLAKKKSEVTTDKVDEGAARKALGTSRGVRPHRQAGQASRGEAARKARECRR